MNKFITRTGFSIIGIWENAGAHTSNITVSGNQFINLAAGNTPTTNRQSGFLVHSHSSATTTVKYFAPVACRRYR